MRRQANPRHDGNEQFRGIVLVPLDRIPVVHRELMVEVVIAFADSDKCGDHMVAGSCLSSKGVSPSQCVSDFTQKVDCDETRERFVEKCEVLYTHDA
jgi:hypothetical protein